MFYLLPVIEFYFAVDSKKEISYKKKKEA